MMNDGGGVVFITAAGDGYNVPDYAAYASCKGAVEVFARCVAKEYGSRCIRANTVAPGGIENLRSRKSLNFRRRPREVERVEPVEVWPYDKQAGCRLSILLRIDAKFLHSRKESRAVHSQACGSTIGTTDAPLTCGERSYDLIALPSFIFVSNAGLVALRICSFSSDLLDLMLLGMRERYRIRFPEFSERRVQRPAARHDHRPLDKVL
jgi:hypothetical protein